MYCVNRYHVIHKSIYSSWFQSCGYERVFDSLFLFVLSTLMREIGAVSIFCYRRAE